MGFTQEALDRFVERQIFFPDPFLICTPRDQGLDFKDIRFETSDGVTLHGWLVPAEPSIGIMLFCHGNAGNISHRVDNIRRLHDIGLSVFIFDYRGYGLSKGRITERGFYLDAEAAYDEVLKHTQGGKLKLVVFGRSLGGIAAVYLASQRPCSGVVLESTFTNLAAMARYHFPLPVPESLVRNRLNSIDRIGKVRSKILFFHGDRDDIVPIELGRDLFNAAQAPKEFVTIPGAGHNDTYFVAGEEYFRKFRDFVQSLPPGERNSDRHTDLHSKR
ncbi:alpha/beta hydrolase [Desulfomonile tiedjei]|uniref:Alpha/beta superfamily hydrolase n=1 Tax=Desulfomonile tiedjei (strain ATCC 49306 / DSM 6799 / DCB-1) TaxID=706587 RepID=I4CEA3_DESTA|nr:alpha/beta hydrolase [Desulfomonile tiedjei]AFM27894.1 alpha/beta superfamily hydrolase [Desulfomonile tiedjei DSM 6799]